MSTGLARCSIGPGISRDARKLTRTPQVIKKKKKSKCTTAFTSRNVAGGPKHISCPGI